MSYSIKRECWNEKTYNGYTDNPYWRIEMDNNAYGLTDAGKLWSIDNLLVTNYTVEAIQKVIDECKLNISLLSN